MKTRPSLLLIGMPLFAVQAFAPDVFERYVEVIGLREQYNGLLFAGFDAARMLSGGGGSSMSSANREADLKRVKEIMIEEVGFDALRSEYLSEIRNLFTEQELSARIADL